MVGIKSHNAIGLVVAVSVAALTSTAVAAATCGTEPVVMNAYFETGFPLPSQLADEFTRQFPNVTFDIKEDQFANMMENTPAPALRGQSARSHPAAFDERPRGQ